MSATTKNAPPSLLTSIVIASRYLSVWIAILLAGFIRSPSLTFGIPYLLGPIAAVVSGGSKGIGKSIAKGLAAENVNIVLIERVISMERRYRWMQVWHQRAVMVNYISRIQNSRHLGHTHT